MSSTVDLVVRGGQVVDGQGGEPFLADIAIDAGRIGEVGWFGLPGEMKSMPAAWRSRRDSSTSTRTMTAN